MWPERIHWVTSKAHPIDPAIRSVPLIGFPAGCLYRTRAIHAIEAAGRSWHMAYTSSGLAGIQAAVAAGLGLSILSDMAIQADHRILTAKEGFAPIDQTEVTLMAAPDASPATPRLSTTSPSSAIRCRRRRRKAALSFKCSSVCRATEAMPRARRASGASMHTSDAVTVEALSPTRSNPSVGARQNRSTQKRRGRFSKPGEGDFWHEHFFDPGTEATPRSCGSSIATTIRLSQSSKSIT